MDQRYGNPVHMAALSMQQHQQPGNPSQYQHPNPQYQQIYQDYADSCYHSTPYHDAGYPCDQYGYHPTASVPYGSGIESYLDPKYAANPAAFASRLPYLPFHAAAAAAYGMYDYSFEPAFIRKRNERERQRVKCVNEGYARLREHLPEEYAEKRLSKVETLRGAIMYIKQLQSLLGFEAEKDPGKLKTKNKNRPTVESAESAKKRKLDESLSSEEHENSVPATGDQKSSFSESENRTCDESNIPDERKRTLAPCIVASQCPVDDEGKSAADDNIKVESAPVIDTYTTNGEEFNNTFDADSVFDSCLSTEFPPCFKIPSRTEGAALDSDQSIRNECESSRSRLSSFDFSQCSYDDVIKGISFDCHVARDEMRRKVDTCDRNSCALVRSLKDSHGQSMRDEDESEIPEAKIPTSYWPQHVLKQALRNNGGKPDYPRHNGYGTYANFALENDKNYNVWNGVQVKSEIQTPPPCLHYDDFSRKQDQNSSLSCGSNQSKLSRSTFGMTNSRPMEYLMPRGGQSDGFKSDTSPESSIGQSP